MEYPTVVFYESFEYYRQGQDDERRVPRRIADEGRSSFGCEAVYL